MGVSAFPRAAPSYSLLPQQLSLDKLRLLERIAEPLDFAHARGFIHRELKPENIMIGTCGEVLVMDWGDAKGSGTRLRVAENEIAVVVRPTQYSLRVTGQGSVLGTPGYMSPEQARGSTTEVDHRTDIFSLDAILWFMLTESTPGELPAGTGSMPRPLCAICEKAMTADANARYQSAGEMTTDIARYLSGAPVLGYPEGLLERASRLYTRHCTAIVLVTGYLLMRVLFIVLERR